MRTYQFVLTFLFLLVFHQVSAQIDKAELLSLNEKRIELTRMGMLTLGTWAVGNFIVSGIMVSRADGSNKAFHQMNIGWNLINVTLAGVGYFHALKADPSGFDLYETIKEQYSQEKTFLFNGGLDIAYIAGGLFMMEKSKNASKHQNLLKGFGQSVIMQGGFLMVFDMAMFFILSHHGQHLKPLMDKVTLSGSLSGFHLQYNF